MDGSVFIDETHGNHIIALLEKSLGNIVTAWGVLVVGMADLLTIEVGDVLIKERTKEQACRLSRVYLIYINMLSQPNGATATPTPVVLVDGLPGRVVAGGICPVLQDTRVRILQDFLPLAISLHVGLSLGFHILVVLEKLRALDEHGIIPFQRVFRYPGLDGSASPTVDNDALSHLGLLKHAFAQEIAHGRERPGILLI